GAWRCKYRTPGSARSGIDHVRDTFSSEMRRPGRVVRGLVLSARPRALNVEVRGEGGVAIHCAPIHPSGFNSAGSATTESGLETRRARPWDPLPGQLSVSRFLRRSLAGSGTRR